MRTQLSICAALLVFALPALARPEAPRINNPGFEEVQSPDGTGPLAWRPANGSQPLTVDGETAFAGRRSLRLDHQPPFVGSLQRLDVRPWRGHTLVLRARLKGQGLGQGTAGLWLRGVDASGKPTGFASSYKQALAGTTGWQVREARLFVGPDTEGLVFGAALGAPGTLWVDDVELQVLPARTAALSDSARDYLELALSTIAENAYYAGRVDWPALRGEVDQWAAGAEEPEGTHPAIMRALQALGDGHSHLVEASRVEELASPSSSATDSGITARSLGRVGYLQVPAFAFTNPDRGAEFSRTLRGHLDAQAAAGSCGWIIDLRENTGGNMYPMIQGLSGLLGGETLGYFVGRDERSAWNARDASSRDGNLHELPGGISAPVAVLQGPQTMSSGEATLLSFVGRANTRRFGEASGGLSTANRMFPLADGAGLVLTTGVMADRSGKLYGGRIEPDEAIAAGAGPEEEEAAARRWLEAQPGCAD